MRGDISSEKKGRGNATGCVGCDGKFKVLMDRITNIQGKLEMMGLKVEESATQWSLESTKQMETFTRLINIEKKCEKIEYSVWELK